MFTHNFVYALKLTPVSWCLIDVGILLTTVLLAAFTINDAVLNCHRRMRVFWIIVAAALPVIGPAAYWFAAPREV